MSGSTVHTVEVKIDGSVLDPERIRIGNLRLRQPVDGHHEFEFECLAMDSSDPHAGENADLDPLLAKFGSEVEINAGYDLGQSESRSDQIKFKGIVLSTEAFLHHETGYAVRIRGASPTVKLDDVPRNMMYQEMTVSDWLQQVVGEVGLDASVASTSNVFPLLVQRGETDWQFARRMLGQQSMFLYYDGTKLHAVDKPAGAELEFGFGVGTMQVWDLKVCATARPGSHEMRVWSPNDHGKVLFESTKSASGKRKPGVKMDADAAKASGSVFKRDGQVETLYAPGEQALLQADANSLKDSWHSSLLVAEGSSDAMNISAGTLLNVKGMGAAASGKYIVTEVTHVFGGGTLEYRNYFKAHAKDAYLPELPRPTARDHELWTATVTSLADPEEEGRVQVKFPNFPEGQEAWVRLCSPYVGESAGMFTFPEIGDEVIVGFTDGEFRYPVILGSVLHPKLAGDALPDDMSATLADETNNLKVLKTRSGHQLIFDETDSAQKITLKTPDDNCILELDGTDGAFAIKLTTQGNVVVTAEQGVTVTAIEDVTVNTDANANVFAKGDVTIEADGDLKATAGGNVDIEGTEISLKSADGSVKCSATGVDVKGAMVKLN